MRPLPESLWSAIPHAPLLRAFDYLAAAIFGAGSALAAWLLVPAPPPAMVEMVLGMVVGTVAVLPLLALLSWILGGFEILVLSVQVGMFAGMVGAMTTAAAPGSVAFEGVLVGLIVQVLVHALDRATGGEVSRDG